MPDLTRLVRRVTRAMGPAATAERVEAVCRVVLEELADRRGLAVVKAADADARTLAVVVSGENAHDAESAVVQTLRDAGCQVVRSVVPEADQRHVVMTLQAPRTGLSIYELRSRADAAAARLGARADVQHEALFRTMNTVPAAHKAGVF